jgi:hypothetical protein
LHQLVQSPSCASGGQSSKNEWGIIHPNEKGDALLELIRERLFVEKEVGRTETLVEAVFHLFETLHDAREIAIPGQHDDGHIGSTIRHKRDIAVWPVVLLWDCVVCLCEGVLSVPRRREMDVALPYASWVP